MEDKMTHDFKLTRQWFKKTIEHEPFHALVYEFDRQIDEALRIMSDVQDGKLLLVKTDSSEVVVPKHATKAMREAIFEYSNAPLVESEIHDLWDAVLSAVPKVGG